MKINELDAIYSQWGEGPSPDEYYEAVRQYFASKQTNYIGEPVVESSIGPAAEQVPDG